MVIKLNKNEEILYQALLDADAISIAKNFRSVGLPTRRNESYHYSDLKMLLDNIGQIATTATSTGEFAFNIANSFQLQIVNGEVQILGDKPPSGVVISTSNGGMSEPNKDIIAQLNSALTKETLHIDVSENLETIIQVDRCFEGKAALHNDGVEIYIANNSSATIVEVFDGSSEEHLSNSASKLILGKNAKATHIMVDISSKKTRHLQTVQYEIEQGANLHSLIIHAGSSLARTQLFANFNGENAHADFAGLMLVDADRHSDITIDVAHKVPNTTSTENFKSVVRNQAKAIFQGKILVAKDAQKTDAAMMHQGLMLSDDAQILVKPELEIYADDVICGHGATCGELDENNLFYLMSRGIEREQAKAMLVRAFLAEIFDPITNEDLYDILAGIADDWLKE